MPYYLQQIAYSTEGWEALVEKPQNRIEAVRPAIEKLGGKIENAWFAFGEYDVVLILQMPTNVDASAISMAFAGGGACKSVKTTPLLTVEEAVEAMKKAAGAGYRAVTAG
ncbi:MAG TPA: GYD domain-containing protein [Pyrinomonadaceae bacterium]|nr:GYD domain-containing protein [Pyrinomonadaceae bacterium]